MPAAPPSAPTLSTIPETLLAPAGDPAGALPVHLVRKADPEADLAQLPASARAWLTATDFKPTAGRVAMLPGADGSRPAPCSAWARPRTGPAPRRWRPPRCPAPCRPVR